MIYVTPLSHLEDTLDKSGASHLVSLASPGKEPPRPKGIAEAAWLSLSMNDISEERDGLVAPSRFHVETVVDFARNWDRRSPLAVSCYAGISRSTAIAYLLTCSFLPNRNEFDLARLLRDLSPSATPNPRIIALGDDLAGRDGRMVAAVRGIGRGRDAFSGEPFVLDLQQISTFVRTR